MISGAARELFEELGVLVARGGEHLTKGQRASLLDDLESGRMSWSEVAGTLRTASRRKRFHLRWSMGYATF